MTFNDLQEQAIHCPCCDACITILIDRSVPQQSYVEDCQVCCRPVVLNVDVGRDGCATVTVRPENE